MRIDQRKFSLAAVPTHSTCLNQSKARMSKVANERMSNHISICSAPAVNPCRNSPSPPSSSLLTPPSPPPRSLVLVNAQLTPNQVSSLKGSKGAKLLAEKARKKDSSLRFLPASADHLASFEFRVTFQTRLGG